MFEFSIIAGSSGGVGELIRSVIKELIGEDKTAIKVPFGNGFFDIDHCVVNTWIIMGILLVFCLVMTAGLKPYHISKRQTVTEAMVVGFRNLLKDSIGTHGQGYRDFLISILIYIGVSNLVGVVGETPPTMDLNVTIALALVSIVLVEVASIRQKKLKGWLKSFAEPMPAIAPMNILELAIKPLSLCMRLFGNVLGATVIMELLKMLVPLVVPAAFSLYFDFFDGLLQAYVFVFLTSLYIKEATE